MKYYSEKLDKLFNTEEALFKAEKEAADKEKEAAAEIDTVRRPNENIRSRTRTRLRSIRRLKGRIDGKKE